MSDTPSMFDAAGGHVGEARAAALADALADAERIVDEATRTYFERHENVGTIVLFSGGNDSTTLLDWAHGYGFAFGAAHVNTGIGIEQTRTFVRDLCRERGIPLTEKSPPEGSTYRDLVLDQGFPGPAMHYKMYQRLKERALREVRREFVKNPRQERVMFLAGRRRDESARRANIVEHERTGSIVWVSPFANWTSQDLNTYRMLHNVPRNEVSDLIHMSGECLCGAFAKPGELDEIGMWFPEVREHIEALEREVEAAGKKRCRWGWGAGEKLTGDEKSGALCSTCVASRNEAQLAMFGEGDR